MNINYVYENMHIIPEDCKCNFTRKKDLNTLEKIALESIAVEFFAQYEAENYGECTAERARELRGYMDWHSDGVRLLDGVFDTYEFDGFLFLDMWATENGCIMMSALEIPESHIDDWQKCDFLCEEGFREVFIRLD